MDSEKPVVIRLKQQYSWKSTYHKYPFYLAEVDSKRLYTRNEVYLDIFKTGTPPVKKGKGQHPWVESAFGLFVDVIEKEVTNEGIGLIEHLEGDQFRISRDGEELAERYRQDPGSQDWKRKFAEIIAMHDIRTRTILYFMGILGYGLHFPDDPSYMGFGKGMPHVMLVSYSEEIPFLSEIKSDDRIVGGRKWVFSLLIDRYRYEVLGPFLTKKIESRGLDLSSGIEFRGGKVLSPTHNFNYSEPTINDLDQSLKQCLSLYKDLEVIIYEPQRKAWVINYRCARDLFSPDLVEDLFVDKRNDQFESVIYENYQKLVDTEGYVRISSLREAVCAQLNISHGESITFFNRQVAQLMSAGRLAIGKTMGWHGSASDALFGDRSKEFVEFIF